MLIFEAASTTNLDLACSVKSPKLNEINLVVKLLIDNLSLMSLFPLLIAQQLRANL